MTLNVSHSVQVGSEVLFIYAGGFGFLLNVAATFASLEGIDAIETLLAPRFTARQIHLYGALPTIWAEPEYVVFMARLRWQWLVVRDMSA
jgi:hypothetical protein